MAIKKKTKYPQFGLDFKNKTFHVVLGLIMICVSIVLFLAFVSFVFNWKQDFDLVHLESTKLLKDTSITASNLLGKIGASLGNFFIYSNFGIASFLFPFYLFISGIQYLTKEHILNLRRLFMNSVFLCLWLSTSLGMVFSNSSIIGGYNGLTVSSFLSSILGSAGATLILVFSILVF